MSTPFAAATGTQVLGRLFRLGSQSDAMFHVLASYTPTDKEYVSRLMNRFQEMGSIIRGSGCCY